MQEIAAVMPAILTRSGLDGPGNLLCLARGPAQSLAFHADGGAIISAMPASGHQSSFDSLDGNALSRSPDFILAYETGW